MDRSRRQGRREARRDGLRDATRESPRDAAPARATPPTQSRLTLRRARNRRRPGSLWSRLPRPRAIADACGRALRRGLPAMAAVAALAALGAGLWQTYRWITRSPRFAITEIAIQGARHVDPAALRARLPVRVGDNAFVALEDIARAVRGEPWVAAADVRRVLPHTLAIAIREHVAAAVVELGELYLVDAAGRPFKRAALDAGEAENLPIITGLTRAAFTADPAAAEATIAEAISALAHWRAPSRPAIGELHIDPHGAVTLHTYDPAIAIQLGALGSEPARFLAFDTAWAELTAAERARTRAIHLDARPDHVTVAFAKD